ncbi:hypothetical protein PUNSTDRAFT_52599 [Punctularia strigosozonata HHB-11173 SS5]|uniref:uncharacterized protein n=1 Tax=Punctularia strigosozonata (strain HHB-11173) TaxID=741275 RepID=UPI0004418327|nr:uncharacterized protein PUNSTDRAFT_52599 [Punctularia strigosozonata HHB-11173 SS5]EIN09371.1 hypothetical protein PUNSTDRAFT_52599 [Punctularia strigosozonata HHB-11173 SS5]
MYADSCIIGAPFIMPFPPKARGMRTGLFHTTRVLSRTTAADPAHLGCSISRPVRPATRKRVMSVSWRIPCIKVETGPGTHRGHTWPFPLVSYQETEHVHVV